MLIAIRFQILHYHGKGSYFKKSELVSKVNLTTKCFSEGVNDKGDDFLRCRSQYKRSTN